MRAELETLPPHYLTQCHRCQVYGHTQATCRRPFTCMKCARPHATTTCTKTRADPSRCCNCGGRHVALYKGCPEFQRRKRRAEHLQSLMAEREMAGIGGRRASRPHSPQELLNAPQGPIQAAKEPLQAAIEPAQAAQESTQEAKEPIQAATESAQPAQEPTQAAQEPPSMPSAAADASPGPARPDKKTLCQQVIERMRSISATAYLPNTDGPNSDEFPRDIMYRLNTAYATLGALLECFATIISISKMDIPEGPADDNK